jgi:hypothetical protein
MRSSGCSRRSSHCGKPSSPGLTGRSSTPRPIGSSTAVSGILDAPLSRSMTGESDADRVSKHLCSRGAIAPELLANIALKIEEGAGNAGCWPHPWPASKQKSWRQSPQVQPKHPAFPARWFYGLYVISLGTGLSCSHHRADVISATYRQRRGDRTTRLRRPHRRRSSARNQSARVAKASIASRLTFGDDWPKRPLHRGGTAGENHTFLKNGS